LLHGTVAALTYGLVLSLVGFFHAGELKFLREIRQRVLPRKAVLSATAGATDVEMAGEIVASAPEIGADAVDILEGDGARPPVRTDSRDPRR
jgi:hypothetical protein